ncbi:MAG: YicC family protein [Candidatus Goldiibacteriota bacterium HGW-Goldbacteria-1]|nr:MAG: YicC family protein [Candidatus Goldiibacteriota bacterium HGW-Goldbacteria-1]
MSYSMTGWGTFRAQGYSINLRGLNSKYKEVVLHLPSEFFAAEPYIYKFLNEKINRGRIDLYVNIEKNNAAKKVETDEKLFKSAYAALKKLYKTAGIKQEVPASLIIERVEGIVKTETVGGASYTWEKVKPSIEDAFEDFMKMKKKEGTRLLADIGKRAAFIDAEAKKIKGHFETFKEEYIQKTRERLSKILEGKEAKSFLSLDVVEALDKHNITEELVRISSHIKQLEVFISSGEVAGRKIDFLAQELYREVNTIASKVSNPAVSHSVISIKETTEKIREQAQNLE